MGEDPYGQGPEEAQTTPGEATGESHADVMARFGANVRRLPTRSERNA